MSASDSKEGMPGAGMPVEIWHNPACGTSRNALALIRHAGIEPSIVEYLVDTPDKARLRQAIADADLSVRDAIRGKQRNTRRSVSTIQRSPTTPCSMRCSPRRC